MTFELTYIAGFFDGEGCIGIYPNSLGGHSLRTQLTQNVSQASCELLEELRTHYGGSLSKQVSLSGKPKFNWQLSASSAVRLLSDMLPHLRIKRDQAVVAIAWMTNRDTKRKKDAAGRFLPLRDNCDLEVAAILKRLKTGEDCDIDVVMAHLVDLVH